MRVVALAVLLLISPVALARAGAASRTYVALFTRGSTPADVCVANLDGTQALCLTKGVGLAHDPTWSPNGDAVAFLTNRDTNGSGADEVYVVNPDASGLRRVTFDGEQQGVQKASPAWSPDGAWIAYLGGLAGQRDVWEVPAAGGAPVRLTTTEGQKYGLAWSPDGTKLLYVQADGGNRVTTVDERTRAVATLGPGSEPVWSPNGTRIAFLDATGRVAVMRADGTAPAELTDLQSAAPAWSPDSADVIFTATSVDTSAPPNRYGYPSRTDIWEAPADRSSTATRLTGPFDATVLGTPVPSTPVFAPDGGQIYYRVLGSGWSVMRMNPDGTCSRPLYLAQVEQGPFWAPGSASGGVTNCVDLYTHAVARQPDVALHQPAWVDITVENHGNQTATGVVVHLGPLNPDMTVSGCSRYGSGLDCALPEIPAGGTQSLAVAFTSTTPGQHTLTVTVDSSPADVTPADAASVAYVDVLACDIAGTWSSDHLVGTPGNDKICGLPGADYISGGKGDDYIDAGAGNDTVYGGPGHDTILGKGGRDTIFARDGQRDYIDCGTEYDVVVADKVDHVSHCERVLRK
jgi:Tol biopolymer transport system component